VAGNIFDVFSKQLRVKGCLEVQGIEPCNQTHVIWYESLTLGFPASCHDHLAIPVYTLNWVGEGRDREWWITQSM